MNDALQIPILLALLFPPSRAAWKVIKPSKTNQKNRQGGEKRWDQNLCVVIQRIVQGGVKQPYLQRDVEDQHHDQSAEDGIYPSWVGNALTFSKVAHRYFM